MYVAPRPNINDDPWFAVRLSLAGIIACLLALLLKNPMPMLTPALTVGIMAGIRRGFDPKKAFGAPIMLSLTMIIFSSLVYLTYSMPLLLVFSISLICCLAYYFILRTGNPAGMLLLIGASLMSSVGVNSLPAMEIMKEAFVEACVVAALLIPVLYRVLKPKNNKPLIEEYVADLYGYHWRRAIIRTLVLFILMQWLYTVLGLNHIMLVISVVFILVFPTDERRYNEAKERIIATLLGGGLSLIVLLLISFIAHLTILIVLLFLCGLYLANKMISGTLPPMVYQFSFTTMIVLVIGGLSTQEPLSSTVLRIGLVSIGAISAVVLTALLERLLIPDFFLKRGY